MLFVFIALIFLNLSEVSPSQELTLKSSSDRMTRVDLITMAALGRIAIIGELYDARTDQFLRISLINGNATSLIQSTHNRQSSLKYLKLNTLIEKMKNLDIKAEFKLSVLLGLVEVSGSGKFFSDKQQSFRSAKVSVANLMTTKFDQITIVGSDARSLIDFDILQKIDATHVVVGIQWGGNVFVSVEDLNSADRDKETVQGSLGGKLKMLVASVSVNGDVSIGEEVVKELRKFNFELHGDVLPTEMPTSLVDAIILMKSLPRLLTEGNDGKGKALTYSLLPITVLRELLGITTNINSLVNSIDESIINSCVNIFDEIQSVELKINDLMIDQKIFQNFISKEKINKIKIFFNRYQLFQNELKRQLSEHLILIRSGHQTVDKLIQTLNEASSHELSPNKIDLDQFLSIQTEFKFLMFLSSLKIVILDKKTSFEHFMLTNYIKNIYAFFYSVDFPKTSDEPMVAFIKLLKKRETFDPDAIYVAVKMDVLREVERQRFFNFAAPTRLRMYKNGDCIVDNYEITTTQVSLIDEPELWSISYMQTLLAQLLSKTNNLDSIQTEIGQLVTNPVPIGYVYVQYPNMPEPKALWPSIKWTQITSRYANSFFRAEGGGSSCLVCQQEQRSYSRLMRMDDVSYVTQNDRRRPRPFRPTVRPNTQQVKPDYALIRIWQRS